MTETRTSALSRRAALATLAGGLAALAARPARAQYGGATFRAVVVDTRPLESLGGGSSAALIRRQLGVELPRAFAGRITGARGAPTLVVRVKAVSLASSYGRDATRNRDSGGGSSDYLEGDALVVAPGGATIARVPMLSAVPADSVGPWYAPDIDPRRVAYLCSHFADWLARKV